MPTDYNRKMRIRFYDTSAGVLVWVICGRIYVFFRGKQIKLGASPTSLSLSLSGSLFPPLTFALTVRWNIKNSRERCAPESNVNGKRQRLRLGRLELGGGNGSWYHNFEMTGNLGQQQEQQCAAAAGRCEMKCERQMGKWCEFIKYRYSKCTQPKQKKS